MKADMLQSLNVHYDGVEEKDILAVVTLLHPLLKTSFSSAEAKSPTCQLFITKMSELSREDVTQLPSPKG